jgi:hypothetical protein
VPFSVGYVELPAAFDSDFFLDCSRSLQLQTREKMKGTEGTASEKRYLKGYFVGKHVKTF